MASPPLNDAPGCTPQQLARQLEELKREAEVRLHAAHGVLSQRPAGTPPPPPPPPTCTTHHPTTP
jgi:hypothetical protein